MRFILCFIFVLFINQLFCQIDFYIETDETCYSFGQDIYLTFNLHNISSDTVIVTFPCSFPFNYYIDDELFSLISLPMIFDITIPPDSTFSTYCIHTDNVNVGNHILIGEFPCNPNNWVTDPVSIIIEQVGIDFSELQPTVCQFSNYPNPFNPETTISFSLKELSHVRLEIYNIRGQKVRTLIDNTLEAKYHTVVWNGTDENNKPVSSGVYFYKFKTESGDYTSHKKMLLMK